MTEREMVKPTILIVDDEAGPRNALQVVLRPFFHLHAVDNAQAALRLLKEGRHHIDLVTLDLKLPDRSGVELLQEIKLEHNDLEVIIITGYGSLKSAMDSLRYGASGYLLKPFNVTELITLIKKTLAKKQRLDRVRHALLAPPSGLREAEPDLAGIWCDLRDQYAAPVPGQLHHAHAGTSRYAPLRGFFSDVLEAANRELFNHAHRVNFYSTRVGGHLRLAETEIESLSLGALTHDIGMIASLARPGAGTKGEGRLPEEDRQHTTRGARMIMPFHLPAEAGQIVVYHHEHFDGSGYPEGLEGEGIPLPARIVSIAQEFDQMISGVACQPAVPVDDAIRQLRNQAGTRFDPQLVDTFAETVSEGATASPFAPVLGRTAIDT